MSSLFDGLSKPAARAVVQQFIQEQLTGRPAYAPHAALGDLKAGPEAQRRLENLIESIEPTGKPAGAWFARAALRDVLDPAYEVLARDYPTPLHRQFTRLIPARDFRAQRLLIGLDGLTLGQIAEHGETPHITDPEVETAAAAVRSWGGIFPLSRQEMTNDAALGYLRTVGEALVVAAYRQEAAEVFGLLEENPNLADGLPWFGADNSASGASEVTALAAGIEAFHGQRFASGEYVAAQPAFLLCPPSWSIVVADVLADMALQTPKISVMKSPHISSAYLLADPARTPALGVLALNAQPILTTGKAPIGTDLGMLLKGEHSFRAVPLSRYGIVKIEKTT